MWGTTTADFCFGTLLIASGPAVGVENATPLAFVGPRRGRFRGRIRRKPAFHRGWARSPLPHGNGHLRYHRCAMRRLLPGSHTLLAARRATAVALFFQWFIVLTGATVRLTGSGLG